MKTHLRDLNFHEEFPEIEIDTEVTPLIIASRLGRVEIVKLLMENEGIDPNIASKDLHLTPLIVACAAGNYEVVEVLIYNGADVNRTDISNRPPLYFCFIRLQEDVNLFENALICMKIANILLQNGADVNYQINAEKGKTLLMEYCGISLDMDNREKEMNLKVVKFLVEHGADPYQKSKKGKTALDYALNHPYGNEVLRILKETQQIYYHDLNRRPIPQVQTRVKKWRIFNIEISSDKGCCASIFECYKR